MPATWKQDDVFPIIARLINDAYTKEQRFITHDEITNGLLADAQVARIMEEAQQQQDERRPIEWLAHNMVAWFSERITVGQSDWDQSFDREKIDGKWAYRPKHQPSDA